MYHGVDRIRTRGGRGRGFVSTDLYRVNPRSDQNVFEVLSDLPKTGGGRHDSGDRDLGIDTEGYTLVRKRQRISTGGGSNEQINETSDPDPVIISNFEEIDNVSRCYSLLSFYNELLFRWNRK